jgi:hypothetical protein
MKFHDYNSKLGLALCTDDDGSNWRYVEAQKPEGLEDTSTWLLRQGHFLANDIPQGLVVFTRMEIEQDDWVRRAGRDVWA